MQVEFLERAATEALGNGDLKTALSLCQEAIANNPKNFRCAVLLSHLLRLNGELEAALAQARKAVPMHPELVEGHYQEAVALLSLARWGEALEPLRRCIQLRPEIVEFRSHLADALEELGRHEEVAAVRSEIGKIRSQAAGKRLELATKLLRQDEALLARDHAEAVLQSEPNMARAHLVLAEILVALSETDLADQHLRRAIELEPNSSLAFTIQGHRYSQIGDFSAAIEAFEKSIQLRPTQGMAYLGLTQAKKINESDRHLLDKMIQLATDPGLSDEERGWIYFAIGKSLDNLGDCEGAMKAFDKGHGFTYRSIYGDSEFNRAYYAAGIGAIKNLLPDKESMSGGSGSESGLPIFIFGSIRSGTTLTEQILSSHPSVGAVGESHYWQRYAPNPDAMAKLLSDSSFAQTIAGGYVETLAKAAPGAMRVTDKLPGNYLRLGVLYKLLPRAKFIHCRRRPIDAAISIYTTPNAAALASLVPKDDVVFIYQQYLGLMDHWRKVMPQGSFLEVWYEDLVSDPEPVVRRMLEFCGLEWNDACLSPEQNKKEVSTPSAWQVRQPIYKSSVERWRRYEPWLGDLRKLLDME